MYDAAMQGIHDKLLVKGIKDGLTFTAELLPSSQEYGLVCPTFSNAYCLPTFPALSQFHENKIILYVFLVVLSCSAPLL
jgi:hypothetical protein